MYIGPKPDGIGADLRLAHIDHCAFDGLSAFNDLDRTYFGHLWELFGLPWEDAYLAGRRTTFHDMTGPMLGQARAACRRVRRGGARQLHS